MAKKKKGHFSRPPRVLTRADVAEAKRYLEDIRDDAKELLKANPEKALNILHCAAKSMENCLYNFENKPR